MIENWKLTSVISRPTCSLMNFERPLQILLLRGDPMRPSFLMTPVAFSKSSSLSLRESARCFCFSLRSLGIFGSKLLVTGGFLWPLLKLDSAEFTSVRLTSFAPNHVHVGWGGQTSLGSCWNYKILAILHYYGTVTPLQ